jgi:two-component system phosphate regulon sensor histidine kinase PhoR
VNTRSKLPLAWLPLMLAVPVTLALLHADLIPGQAYDVAGKLALVFAVVSATGLLLTYAVSARWAARTKLLEEFVAGLPNTQNPLPEGGPEELQTLAKSMRSMANRVHEVVDRANLELSRRETILACMTEGVLSVDKDLRVNFCNEAFAAAFGTRTQSSEGRSLYELVREPALREILARVVSSGTPEKDLLRLPSAAGRWFEARTLPLGQEPRRGAVIALHDVTDIQHQEQMRKDFVADVSHELRTPLAAIRGYSETLLDGGLEDRENNRRFVEIIFTHAVRLNNIASDLLVISELDNNTAPSAPLERVSVLDVVRSALNTVQRSASERGIRLNAENCLPCYVNGLRFRLEQVMVNLVDNAVKFNRPNGEVVVECRPGDREYVRITVADSGIGIPNDDLKRIFERFYRVDKSRSRPAGGTGLGLPIVKEVVERMGGTVSVESTLGKGSKFTVLLRSASVDGGPCS